MGITRNLKNLTFNSAYKSVKRPKLDLKVLDKLERHFGIKVPDEYVQLLKFSNGCSFNESSYVPEKLPTGYGMITACWFYGVYEDQKDSNGLWWAIEGYRAALGVDRIPISSDPGGDMICLNVSISPAFVEMWMHEIDEYIFVAKSFEEYVDGLFEPEDDEDDDDGEIDFEYSFFDGEDDEEEEDGKEAKCRCFFAEDGFTEDDDDE